MAVVQVMMHDAEMIENGCTRFQMKGYSIEPEELFHLYVHNNAFYSHRVRV